ncbi:MAG: hypothetical protein ACRENC_14580, partial [Gemmatimonadaceae bacterium]
MQGAARFEQRLLGRAFGDRHSARDLHDRQAAQLAHQQRRTLTLGQRPQIRDEQRQPFAHLQ